jgi:hypothetical protein
LTQPHVIDQCACNGEISTISDDVRERYETHRSGFVPTIYEDYEEEISSCSVRNQALVWLSSGDDFEFGKEERQQRFALASMFIGTHGEGWTENTDWLSEKESCEWLGATCNAEGAVENLIIESNKASGSVRSQ